MAACFTFSFHSCQACFQQNIFAAFLMTERCCSCQVMVESPCRTRSRFWQSLKRLIVGQLFSDCKRTGEMQKVECLRTSSMQPKNEEQTISFVRQFFFSLSLTMFLTPLFLIPRLRTFQTSGDLSLAAKSYHFACRPSRIFLILLLAQSRIFLFLSC